MEIVRTFLFTGNNCPGCRQIKTSLDKDPKNRKHLRLCEMDVNSDDPKIKKLAEEWFIRSIPTIIFAVNGKPQEKLTGSYPIRKIKDSFNKIKDKFEK